MRSQQQSARAGVTLVEMLLVMTLIGLMVSIAYPRVTDELSRVLLRAAVEEGQRYLPGVTHCRQTSAQVQINAFITAVKRYYVQNGRYPTSEEGLQAVRRLLTRDIPTDPWGNPYVYRYSGEHGSDPDLMSFGADGKPGGNDDARSSFDST